MKLITCAGTEALVNGKVPSEGKAEGMGSEWWATIVYRLSSGAPLLERSLMDVTQFR